MKPEDSKTADILMGDVTRLEDVLSRDDVTAVSKSFFSLFGLPVRVISDQGVLLADIHRDQPLCSYLNTLQEGAQRCAATVSRARDVKPRAESVIHPCFTGAEYRVVPLSYQGRLLGRFILGPYVPAERQDPALSLLSMDGTDRRTLQEQHALIPRVRQSVAEQLCDHLKCVIELLVFSGHRAQLASTMQVESVRETYRELAIKNDELEESVEELKHLDQLKSTFLATVSHELRTPLTSIIGYTEMLEIGAAGVLNAEQTEFLGTIRGKADELLRLISSLLDLGRLEADELELSHEEVDPRALLSAVGATIVPAANRRNVHLDIRVEDESPKIWGDPIRLRQILLNLADNAVKFTDRDGTVELSATRGDLDVDGPSGLGAALFATTRPAVVLKVRDDGIGIEEEKLSRIFDAFYQVDGGTTRKHGGAGLGLSIVKQLVESHDGTIEVTSEPGRGTLFTVTLPAAGNHA